MLQPLIVDKMGIAHGVKRDAGTRSWCGTSLKEWVRLGGVYHSIYHQAAGYDPRGAVTCLSCLSEGP